MKKLFILAIFAFAGKLVFAQAAVNNKVNSKQQIQVETSRQKETDIKNAKNQNGNPLNGTNKGNGVGGPSKSANSNPSSMPKKQDVISQDQKKEIKSKGTSNSEK